jgi:hypothetical protein
MWICPAKFTEFFPQLIQGQGRKGNIDQAPGFAQSVFRQIWVSNLKRKNKK